MTMQVEVSIQDGLTYQLKRYEESILKKVRELINDLITKTEIDATRDAPGFPTRPGETGSTAPKFISIGKRFEDGGYTGRVGVIGRQVAEMKRSDPNNMAAYLEFGTGLSASEILEPYPQWVKDIAWKYYVNGQGTLQGKPYLFNNFLRNHAKFERELKSLVEKVEKG